MEVVLTGSLIREETSKALARGQHDLGSTVSQEIQGVR